MMADPNISIWRFLWEMFKGMITVLRERLK